MRVRWLSDEDILEVSKRFLAKYNPSLILPVPIEEIAELSLKITMIPIPNLEKVFGHESFISGDFKHITIDEFVYENNGARTRFTVAHEIGHIVLHKSLYERQKIGGIDEFLKFQNSIEPREWQRLDIQANRFAGGILFPEKEFEKVVKEGVESVGGLNSFTILDLEDLVKKIKEVFDVSGDCVKTQLKLKYPYILEIAERNLPF